MWLMKYKEALLNCLLPERAAMSDEEISEEEMVIEKEKLDQEIQKFTVNNVIFDKLNYLEQYIKIFSLTFQKEYEDYLSIIQNLRSDYEKELEEYKRGLYGEITFSIDPENESKRYIAVVTLENKIKTFVDSEVNYKVYKEKFSKLCYKLNFFYNALINTEIEVEKISNQLKNACSSLKRLVDEVKAQEFFINDSRKKEEILSYIIYSEYIIFKSFFRCSTIRSFDEYKNELSEFHSLFVNEEYDRLVFKFFIEDLENLQIFITDNFKADSSYQYIIETCQRLQNRLDNYVEVFDDYKYFESLIKFENTIDNLSRTYNIKFNLGVSKKLDFQKQGNEIINVNNIAVAVLNLIDNQKAQLLLKVVSNFNVEISWREFYFLCKIFEIYDELVEVSSNTIFSMIEDKFLKLEEKYKEYTYSYIMQEKKKILNYNGSKSKKYILLIKVDTDNISETVSVLKELNLDFVINRNEVYINRSYFNGFKNLEENFGEYKIF